VIPSLLPGDTFELPEGTDRGPVRTTA
jgi:hypothetical protein